MSRFLVLICQPASLVILVACILSCGCNKHVVLLDQKAKMDEERAALLVQIRDVDFQIQLANSKSSVSKSLREAEESREKADTVQATATAAMHKWSSFEKTLQNLRARAQEYSRAGN